MKRYSTLAGLAIIIIAVCPLLGLQVQPDRPHTQPARIGMLCQTDAPALLVRTTHTTTDLLDRGILRNHGDRGIVRYRLGWVVEQPGKKPLTQLGDWVSVSAGIPPGGEAEIPSQLVSFSLIKKGATRVEFFVAGVVFGDGNTWEADLEKLVQIPPSGQPQPIPPSK